MRKSVCIWKPKSRVILINKSFLIDTSRCLLINHQILEKKRNLVYPWTVQSSSVV